MRAKLINEIQNFERGQDPKRSTSIGIVNWKNLSAGDILIFTKKAFLNPQNYLQPNDDSFHTLNFFQEGSKIKIVDIKDNISDYSDLGKNKFIGFRLLLNNSPSVRYFRIFMDEIDFLEFFGPSRRNIKESTFKRGMDPKTSMKLGLKQKLIAMIPIELKNSSLWKDDYYDCVDIIKNPKTEIDFTEDNRIVLKARIHLATWRLKNLSTMINFKGLRVREIDLSVEEDAGDGEEIAKLDLKIV